VAAITLASDDVASLFAVPADDWTAINKRVGLVWLARNIVSSIERYLPTFPALETASQTWKDATFPGLVQQAGAIATYSGQAITGFTSLQSAIQGLDPNAPLPANVKTQAQTTLDGLATSSSTVAATAKSLGNDVAAFTSQNQIVDQKIHDYIGVLGSDWTVLTAETDAVDQAVGLVRGSWSAIVDDLANVTSGQIQITTAFLLGLDIASALLSWQHIQVEAQAFASMAGGQGQYLDGSWVG
jgi:hypothetical protein